jgi:benzoyl-CoA 2,3-dioxygenase component B
MLTEEAHHMFVGQTGVGRVVERCAQLMRERPGRSPREAGAIDLPTIQKYINFWASSSNDLYGAEVSSNSANFFGSSLKGRAWEMKNYEEHSGLAQSKAVTLWEEGRLVTKQVPLRNAMNEVLREDFIEDNQKGVNYWNRILEEHGVSERLRLPHRRFNRRIGSFAAGHFDIDGNALSTGDWDARKDEWLPSAADRAYVAGLMVACTAAGRMAGWLAPPSKGINGQPLDFEYVRS